MDRDSKMEMAGHMLRAQIMFFDLNYKAGDFNFVGVLEQGFVFERAHRGELEYDFYVRTLTVKPRAWLSANLEDTIKYAADYALHIAIIDLMVEHIVRAELTSSELARRVN